jgi:hypothetical protein
MHRERMSFPRRRAGLVLAAILLSFVPLKPVLATISCEDVKNGSPSYEEKMGELARQAELPGNYWSRYHESIVSDLCSNNSKGVNKLVDYGFVKPREVEGIARVLGKMYKATQESQAGKAYARSRQRFVEMGACTSCADNIAQYYIRDPSSPCGKLAKHALDGNTDAIKKLTEFPDYCKWKY